MDRRYFLKACLSSSIVMCCSGLSAWKIISKPREKMLIQYELATMNTKGEIKFAPARYPHQTTQALKAAITRMDYLVEKLSKFNPDSDIGLLNANPRQWVPISQDTARLLSQGLILMQASDGYFDMGMGNFLCLKGLDDSVPMVGTTSQAHVQARETLLKIDGNMAYLNRPNSMLDLGGIAKGYILEEMITTLKQHEIRHAAIDLGGDLAVMGGRLDGQPWTIGIDPEAPIHDPQSFQFSLHEGGVASSGGYRKRAFDQQGPIKHHIIDPHTLSSKEDYALVTTIGPSPTVADVLAKVCFNTPSEQQKALNSKYPEYQFISWQKGEST